LNEKLTNLTERWDEMLRWAAGRYQLLVLSRHYLDSSKQVVLYLNKIEEKMSSAKDIPPGVLEKIKEESEKAKVDLNTFLFSTSRLLTFFVMLFELFVSNWSDGRSVGRSISPSDGWFVCLVGCLVDWLLVS